MTDGFYKEAVEEPIVKILDSLKHQNREDLEATKEELQGIIKKIDEAGQCEDCGGQGIRNKHGEDCLSCEGTGIDFKN